MAHHFLQANVNHCAAAQDLLLQSMAQWLIEIAIVSEPYFVPPRSNWVADVDGSVAIVSSAVVGPLSVVARGRGYAAVKWRESVVIGVYFSPNATRSELETFLDGLGAFIGQTHPRPVLVAGDLNAKSVAWGSPATDPWGETLEEWVTTTGLCVLNQGSVNTCIRRSGGSIVDITFASPVLARRVSGWKVLEEVETLSDHLYVRFSVSNSSSSGDGRQSRQTPTSPKWALWSLNRDLLIEAAIVRSWETPPNGPMEIEEEVEWFQSAMTQICDTSMSRAKPQTPRRSVYWWSPEISDLRRNCVEARRRYTRHRRMRRRDEEVEEQLYVDYRASAKALQLAIHSAKEREKAELLETLNNDPWGRPYKMVRGKIRPWAPPLTESLEPELVEEVVSGLFPSESEFQPPQMVPETAEPRQTDDVVPPVLEVELELAILKLRAKNKAPGPDGIHGRAWVIALRELGDRFRGLLSNCLELGRFPTTWKTGRLVLLKKDGRPADSPSAYRPLVMLNEADKLFERIIAARLVQHLRWEGPDLSDHQFGFRVGRSTIDAINLVKCRSEEVVASGGVMLAVSLDIANAFNTLPWACVREALKYHEVPSYLRRIVSAYLSGRYITYTGRNGGLIRREMSCGVPQGSVLGPLLWNIGYDWVLRGTLNQGAGVVCYADDTLVTARGETFNEAVSLVTVSVAQVVDRIEQLGLRVALDKSEAICFHGPRRAPPRGSHISIGAVNIEVDSKMKYLGLYLDSKWNFREHFTRMVPRLMGAANSLKRLLPNLGGPKAASRRLYLGVVQSMALYGAPVWAPLDNRNITLLNKAQRVMAIGVIRGYRTVSREAACMLAGSPPWDLEAECLLASYKRRSELRSRGEYPPPAEEELAWRRYLREAIVEEWSERLEEPSAGRWTIEAVQPILSEWLDRAHGSLSFRLVQVLTGHGCFGKYLCQIARREPTTACHHCGCDEDTASHTLVECEAWVVERSALVAVVGRDLSLPALIKSMLENETSWDEVVTFCDSVMSQKEAAEREREITSNLPIRSRRARRGRRWRQSLHDIRPP